MAGFLVSGILAGQPVAACPGRPPLTVQLAAERERVALSADLSLSELRSLSARSGRALPHRVLGYSTSSFHYTVQTTIGDERRCGEPVVVRLMLVLDKRRITVAREVMDQDCLRDAALAHYHRHAEADSEAFTHLVTRVELKVSSTSFQAALRNQDLGVSEVERRLRSAVEGELPAYDEERHAGQAAVDTPGQVAALEDACKLRL